MKHAMMLELTDGKLHFAPIKEDGSILDLGTGTGIWAIDMGDKYPGATVTGVDLSPIQPLWVPPNVKFMVDDIEDTWSGTKYDFIHTRAISPIVKDLAKLLRQSFDHLKPGGYLEGQEFHVHPRCDDGTMSDEYPVLKFYDLLAQAFGKLGFDIHIPVRLADMMREAGFVNVKETVLKVPIGIWAKDKNLRLVGMYWRMAIHDLLPAMGGKPFLSLGMSPEEIEVFLVGVRKALSDTKVHSYIHFHFVYGQKPE